jgi:hypothetical protein
MARTSKEKQVTDLVEAGTGSTVAPTLAAVRAPAAPNNALNDCSNAHHLEQRYLAKLGELVDDALERKSIETLVEALTWTLARIGATYGAGATGDILRRLGGHLCEITAREQAEREAAEAKKRGLATH